MSDNEIKTGQATVTAAGTAELLITMGEMSTRITIKALATNTGNIYVGTSTVDSADGFILAAGEEVTIVIEMGQTDIYIDSDVNGEGVSYIYWNGQ
jgi:hypothetical protein